MWYVRWSLSSCRVFIRNWHRCFSTKWFGPWSVHFWKERKSCTVLRQSSHRWKRTRWTHRRASKATRRMLTVNILYIRSLNRVQPTYFQHNDSHRTERWCAQESVHNSWTVDTCLCIFNVIISMFDEVAQHTQTHTWWLITVVFYGEIWFILCNAV